MRTVRPLAAILVVSALQIAPGVATPAQAADPSIVGRWSAPINVGLVGIHAALLHTGEVLLWQDPEGGPGSKAHLWNPATGANRDVSVPYKRDLFCSASTFMPDGRLLVVGGDYEDGGGATNEADIFDPANGTWSPAASMAARRYYPSSVQLSDGTTLVLTGSADSSDVDTPVKIMESFDPIDAAWTTLPPSANNTSDLYSRVFLLPNGRVFRAGPQGDTQAFDPPTNSWSPVGKMRYGARDEGTAVLLPGLERILAAGGSAFLRATNTAEVIDFSQASPAWSYTGRMKRARMYHNLTLLADGTALAVGGGGVFGLYLDPIREAEIYDPATGKWTLMAAQKAQRTYHSTAILLPDGRVLSAGSELGSRSKTIELFSPPYLFKGPRPVISSGPSSVTYGQSFTIGTADAADIGRVALVRPGAVTHGTNFEQRYVDLAFTASGGGLTTVAPSLGSHAPPGWYLLFIVNKAGVPAVATFVHLS